jgi:hypothetical protein
MVKIVITNYSSVSENTTDLFSIYPNPTTDILNIKGDLTGKIIEILDISGKSHIKTLNKSIDVSDLTTGVYFLKVDNSVKKFIKNKPVN